MVRIEPAFLSTSSLTPRSSNDKIRSPNSVLIPRHKNAVLPLFCANKIGIDVVDPSLAVRRRVKKLQRVKAFQSTPLKRYIYNCFEKFQARQVAEHGASKG
jgi:hypothetical protein